MTYCVTYIPGDGIGPEVMDAAKKVLEATGIKFEWDTQEVGEIPEIDLWNTFNLGVGFCLIAPKKNISAAAIKFIFVFKGKKKWIKNDKKVNNVIPIKPISENLKSSIFKFKIYFEQNNPAKTDKDIKKIKENNISTIYKKLFMLNNSFIFYFYNLITLF